MSFRVHTGTPYEAVVTKAAGALPVRRPARHGFYLTGKWPAVKAALAEIDRRGLGHLITGSPMRASRSPDLRYLGRASAAENGVAVEILGRVG